jgi:hypothetical protein
LQIKLILLRLLLFYSENKMYFVITDKYDRYLKFNDSLGFLCDHFKFKSGLNQFYYRQKPIVHSLELLCDPMCSPLLKINSGYYIRIVIFHYGDIIILSDRYYLYDTKTIKLFNLYNTVNECYIENACVHGNIKFLEWWRNSGLPLKYDKYAINYASENGHIHVLEWWKNSGLKLKYSDRAMLSALQNKHINVILWWFNSGLTLKTDFRGALNVF